MQQKDPVKLARRMSAACLGTRVGRLHRIVTRRFEQALRPLGLSLTQLELLAALSGCDTPCKPNEVAEVLAVERSTMSRNLSLLESRGLVATTVRSASGRSLSVEITAEGAGLLVAAESAWAGVQGSLTDVLGADAPAALDGWLTALAGTA